MARRELGPDGQEYIVTVRRKPKNPTWLKAHQEKFTAATRQASAETRHLTGPARVAAMNKRVKEIMAGG
ncbi:MAG: hypothetical protein Q8R28_14980 [Dehalococcoidia bacterium]|nr:hypothetical protein [Dehalococcoidia bacterium]